MFNFFELVSNLKTNYFPRWENSDSPSNTDYTRNWTRYDVGVIMRSARAQAKRGETPKSIKLQKFLEVK